MRADDALVLDGGFGVALLQEAGATRYVVRLAKNCTARRATPPPYDGRGRPATRGRIVRPLPRTYRGRAIPATVPDRVETWREDGALLRAERWTDLVRPEAAAASPTFTIVALHDPRHREPLVLATSLPVPPRALRALYRDRWPVEQLPLAAKQMLGAAPRQFVHAPETCQRLPELALLAGAVLSYAAATAPAVPHRLLGPPAPADPRPAAAPPGAHPVSARLPAPRPASRKSAPHRPPAEASGANADASRPRRLRRAHLTRRSPWT